MSNFNPALNENPSLKYVYEIYNNDNFIRNKNGFDENNNLIEEYWYRCNWDNSLNSFVYGDSYSKSVYEYSNNQLVREIEYEISSNGQIIEYDTWAEIQIQGPLGNMLNASIPEEWVSYDEEGNILESETYEYIDANNISIKDINNVQIGNIAITYSVQNNNTYAYSSVYYENQLVATSEQIFNIDGVLIYEHEIEGDEEYISTYNEQGQEIHFVSTSPGRSYESSFNYSDGKIISESATWSSTLEENQIDIGSAEITYNYMGDRLISKTRIGLNQYGDGWSDKIIFSDIYSTDGNYIGTSSDDLIYGSDSNDYIIGGVGEDTIIGGNGNDTIIGGISINDGHKATGIPYGWDSDKGLLYGEEGNDVIYGGAHADIISGGAGVDTLYGGDGDDIYLFDVESDIDIIYDKYQEYTDIFGYMDYNAGNDVVQFGPSININDLSYLVNGNDFIITTSSGAQLAIKNQNLSENKIEYFKMSDESIYTYQEFIDSIDAINNSNNGTSGDDTLYGSAGADLMKGYEGNDTYYVDNLGDQVIELANQGTDKVISSINYKLATNSNIEEVTLSGSANTYAIGDNLDNILTGNSGNNTLVGLAGDDTLDGGAGADLMKGYEGNDTYVFNIGDGLDRVNDYDITLNNSDKILFGENINKEDVAIFKDNNNLILGYSNNDFITVENYATQSYEIERLELNDGSYLTNIDINQIIQDMTSFASSNGIDLTGINDVKGNQDLMNIIVTSWNA